MALTIEDRKFIQGNLPYGSQTEIARKLGITRMAVNQYFTGSRNSKRIEEAAIIKYEEVKKEREELRKRIYERV